MQPTPIAPQRYRIVFAAVCWFLPVATVRAEDPPLRDLLRDGLYAEEVTRDAAAAANQRNAPETSFNVELGLGGLTALLASLERTMVFDAMKQESNEGRNRTILQGHWKKEIAQRFPKEKNDVLPVYVPDFVRLYVNTETLFPERIIYLKKQPEKKTLKSLVSLDFQNVVLDGTVDENEFVFEIPKDVIPEDITKVYLDRLMPPAEEPKK